MVRASFLLVSFFIVLAWTSVRYGGVLAEDWNYALLGLGIILFVGYLAPGETALAAPPDWPLYLCAVALPGWAVLQLVPLPLGVLEWLSPARADLTRSLLPFAGGIPPATLITSPLTNAPLSIRPEATRQELLHLIGYVVAFLLARDMMWRFPRGQWRVAAPLLAVATLEACLGLVQDAVNTSTVYPSGTFVNRDHFSALLEMTLPFAVGGAVEYWSRTWRRPFIACTLAAGAAIMLSGVAVSLSRAGFLIAIGNLTILGSIQAKRRFHGTRRLLAIAGGSVALLGTVVVLATPRLLGRFSDHGVVADLVQESRWNFWRETLHLVALFPWTGSGFGTFASGVARFRQAAPTRTLDYAHNVPLQFLAEGGFIALGIGIAGMVLLLRRLNAAWPVGARRAELPLACGLSVLAALAHSLVDFNLSIPACAIAFAWVAGMAAGLRFSPPVPTHRPHVPTRDVLNQFRR